MQGDKKMHREFWRENWKERGHIEGLGVDRRTTLTLLRWYVSVLFKGSMRTAL
jgi:hypothetical protein